MPARPSRRLSSVIVGPVVAGLVLAGAVVAGCTAASDATGPASGGPTSSGQASSRQATSGPGGAPTSGAPTPAVTPPPATRPTPPPEMARDDEVGAMAAAEYFLTRLYPYTVSSQDTGPWREMSHADCVFCTSTLETVASLQADGGSIEVAPIRAMRPSQQRLSPLAHAVFLAIETGSDVTRDRTGAISKTSTSGSGSASIVVVRQHDRWLIRGVELKKSE